LRRDIFHQNPDIVPDGMSYPQLFNETDAISGDLSEMTPEFAIKLGRACAGTAARIAVGYSECGISKLLADAFIAGAGAAGAQVTETDAGFFAAAAFISRTYLFNLTVFIENDCGRLRIRMADKHGLSVDRKFQNEIAFLFAIDDKQNISPDDVLMPKNIVGVKEAFARSAARPGALHGFSIAVNDGNPVADILKYALTLSGCKIVKPRRGTATLAVSADGEKLRITDEKERAYDDGHVSALLALTHFLDGGQALSVSPSAPSALEQIASEFGGRIMRIGRDHGAREVFINQGMLTNAVSAAVFLCLYLYNENITVSELAMKLPVFTLVSREISLNSDRKMILDYLAENRDGLHKENTGELRVCADGGWINIAPTRSRSSLRVTGEAMNEEIASELCDLYIDKARFLDAECRK